MSIAGRISSEAGHHRIAPDEDALTMAAISVDRNAGAPIMVDRFAVSSADNSVTTGDKRDHQRRAMVHLRMR
jgi:hypothetical protein